MTVSEQNTKPLLKIQIGKFYLEMETDDKQAVKMAFQIICYKLGLKMEFEE